jgi:prephenate dehydrogenase
MQAQPRVAIVGVGLIGGSLGLAFKRGAAAREVVGVSRRETVAAAVKLGAIDRGFAYEALAEAVAGADLVILAPPIQRIQSLLGELAGLPLPPGLVVTDVGSTKTRIVRDAARLLPAGVFFIGGHPMAGSEKSGVGAADPFLFQNALYVLCPAPGVIHSCSRMRSTSCARPPEFPRRRRGSSDGCARRSGRGSSSWTRPTTTGPSPR